MSSPKTYELLCALTLLLVAVCQGAPSYQPTKRSWRDDNNVGIQPALTTCDPATGKCWDYWPKPGDVYAIPTDEEADLELNRQQLIRAREVDQDSWRDVAAAPFDEAMMAQQHPNSNQQVGHGKMSKKNVFVSRSWSAGGGPFSVLYMSPRNHLSSSSSSSGSSSQRDGNKGATPASTRRKNSTQQQQLKESEGARVSTRNSIGEGTRKYSSIPHLFVSYGWGPSGIGK